MLTKVFFLSELLHPYACSLLLKRFLPNVIVQVQQVDSNVHGA